MMLDVEVIYSIIKKSATNTLLLTTLRYLNFLARSYAKHYFRLSFTYLVLNL